jgi:hypothetical protein
MIPATMVSMRASSRVLWARFMTIWVKTMPAPVSDTTPMMIPAHAQASATGSALRAPSIIASTTLRSVTFTRVEARSAATGKHASVPASAASGAL